ncbi:MAG TPA: hypothetical protein VN429_10470 [Methanospirillum sp.]|uniref:hypothetical protein n=1 Tax=Methanospirillum sp. TaxID=45200 RepID=UPI002C89E621|nr:hypothetical protein [Methanospirillum sp.]HWQ64829.1 hypothetical protein [Methanospirillum sp.]
MKLRIICLLFTLYLIIHIALAAQATFSVSAEGAGTFFVNNGEQWNAGMVGNGFMHNGEQYNGGTSADQIVSGNGNFHYEDSSTLDARINNRYSQSGFSEFHNGVNFGTHSSLADASANVTEQYADATYGGFLQEAYIKNSKFVNNANMSAGQQVAWNGAGQYHGSVNYGVSLGTGGNSSTIDYVNEGHKKIDMYTNQSGGGNVRPEFSYTDFSDSYLANITGKVAVNQTAFTVNSTEN